MRLPVIQEEPGQDVLLVDHMKRINNIILS